MTLINEWTAESPRRRLAFYLCDGCDPPRPFVGEVEMARRAGWSLLAGDNAGRQFCPWCGGPETAEGRWVSVSSQPALPNLLIIGAAKAGTTSLHHYLDLHPEIAMAQGKELHFFARDFDERDLEVYATHFDGSAPVRGESSPTYTFFPVVPGVPARIKQALPDVRLIYLVRDPIDRAIASYVEGTSQEWEPLPIGAAMGDRDPRNPSVAQSRYGTQLEQYLEHFPRESILILDQADMARDGRGTLRRVFEFLDVDADFWTDEFERRHNTRGEKFQRTALGRRLRRTSAARLVRRLPPAVRHPVFSGARMLTRTSTERTPQLSEGDRRRLASELSEEIDKFERLAGFRPAGLFGAAAPGSTAVEHV